MAFVPPARHLLRAKELADARFAEPLGVDDLARLGMEVRADVTLPEMGDFRWLTVGPAGQPDVSIVFMAIPGPPVMDAETAQQVRELMAKGFAGTIFLTTDDCRAM